MKLLLLIITLFQFASCSNDIPENINGNWNWKQKDSLKDFSLEIKQNDKEIEGSYCGIYNGGTRIDCPIENEKNLKGKFKNGRWEINYTSNYSGKKGKAIIVYNKKENSLTWKDLSPNNGSFCPENAILFK